MTGGRAIHVRVRRLVVDAAVLTDGSQPAELEVRLMEALSALLGGPREGTAETRANGDWVGVVAGEIHAQLAPALPEGTR